MSVLGNQVRNGTLVENGAARWCTGCHQVHGPLYRCVHYPPRVFERIDREAAAARRDLGRRWESGDRSPELMIMIAFCGMETEEAAT